MTTPPTTPPPLTQKWPTLAAFEKEVNEAKTPGALNGLKHNLVKGGGVYGPWHRFTTSDVDLAWKVLFGRAKVLGAVWDKHLKRFIEKTPTR